MTIIDKLLAPLKEALIHKDLSALALLLSFTILAEEHIPDPLMACFLLAASLLHMFSSKGHPQYKLRFLLSMIFSIAVYAVAITTYYPIIEQSCSLLAGFFIIQGLLRYFTPCNEKPYVPQLLTRLMQSLIAIGYVLTIYFAIYLSVFFIGAIFDYSLFTSDLFRIATACAGFSFFMVLFSIKENALFVPGTFFKALFGKILPALSIICGVLATVYLTQMLLGIRNDVAFLYTYYPYICAFYFFFIAGSLCQKHPRVHTLILSLFLIITAITIAFILKRQLTIPSQQVSSIYALLCNGLFFCYNAYILFKQRDFSYTLTKIVSIISIIIFLPLFGYISYVENVTYKGSAPHYTAHYDVQAILLKTKSRSLLEAQQEQAQTMGINPRELPLSFYLEKDSFKSPLSIEGYRLLLLDQQLNDNTPSLSLPDGRGVLSLSSDKKTILFTQSGEVKFNYPIYEEVKGRVAENKDRTPAPSPIIVETEEFKLFITNYMSALDAKSPWTSITFHLLLK